MAARTGARGDRGELAGPVLFAYDGSELADFAIRQASVQLAPGRECLVLCVWQPSDVGFLPAGGRHLHAADPREVRQAAEETATQGAELAEEAGFRARGLAIEAAPTWEGILAVAEEHSASLIVLGSHPRKGLMGHLLGSVAAATVARSRTSVLVVRR